MKKGIAIGTISLLMLIVALAFTQTAMAITPINDLILPSDTVDDVPIDLVINIANYKLNEEKVLGMYSSLKMATLGNPVLSFNSNGIPSAYKVPLKDKDKTVGIIYISAKKFGPPIIGLVVFSEPSNQPIKSEVLDVGVIGQKMAAYANELSKKTELSAESSIVDSSIVDSSLVAMNMWNNSISEIEKGIEQGFLVERGTNSYGVSSATTEWHIKNLNVPHLGWDCGCTPTAIAMILRYHGGSCITPCMVAPAIGTDSQGNTNVAKFLLGQVDSGTEQVASDNGIMVDSNTVWLWTYGGYVNEIDSFRPVGIHNLVGWNGATSQHSVAGEGYKYRGIFEKYYLVDDPNFAGSVEWNYYTCIEACHTRMTLLSICTISITIPTQSNPASAGAFDNPSHIDVTVEVKQGTTPVTGLANADFSFKIGGKTATASLIDTSIPGTYTFDVTPPTQVAAGKYDLEVPVTYGNAGCSFTDTEQDAVEYTSGNVDVMLIIDRSGSMSGSRIADAKTSAKLFINYMRDNDKAGVVSFSYGGSYNYHLTTLTPSVKTAIKNAINSISAYGMTAMGSGLRYGYNDLVNRGDSTHPWAMVLLSDGYHNWGEHPNNVLPAIRNANIKVFTIGLGPYVDTNLLRNIATNSGAGGGKYYHAPSSSDLKEIYDLIVGMVTGQQTSYSTTGTILPAQTSSLTVPITSSTTSATFSISWGGSDLDLVLYKPDGTEINPGVAAADPDIDYVEESTYEFYRVANPDAGEWTMEITAISVPTGGEDYTAKIRVASTLTISLSTDKDQYNQGETVKTTVSLTEGGSPLTGATVSADITLPDGSTEVLTLYDDGGHGDTAANDGVYANYFANTLRTGDYTVDVSATGTTSSGEQFSREDQCTFKVVAGPSLITLEPDTWTDNANVGQQIQSTFTVNDPAKIGELFPLDESTYAEYNGTHYFVYDESSIGGEPDYIIPAPPTSESLADVSTVSSAKISISPLVSTRQLSSNPVSKWVSLTATSLQTPTGDMIDVSNIIISPNVLEVPLGGSKDFDVNISIPSDAVGGTYTGKIVASAITGSDSIDVEITVISNLPPIADVNGPYTGFVGEPITFNGTASYDPDGTIVSYEWDLDDDGEFDEALGVTPAITFDEHYSGNIHLKVTDDNGATNIDTTTLTVLIPATIDFDPDTLNKKSKGKWVTVYTELLAGYNITDINVSTILLNEIVPAELQPTEVGDYDSDGILDLMVKFDRQAVSDILQIGDTVDMAVTGKLYDGASFEGSDTIRVLNEG